MKKLFPNVASLKLLNGIFKFEEPLSVCLDRENVLESFVMFNYKYQLTDASKANLVFTYDENIIFEGYKIVILDNVIKINYSSLNGAFYSLITLNQILSNDAIPNLEINDYPAVKVRGLMFDISRDKVATPKTIKQVLDLMANLKMNHFELYVEGFSYEYKSFSEYLEKDGFITVDEWLDLQEYAMNRFIDFVPNQNGFGHMAKWLEKEELKDLAVAPDGIFLWGRHRNPSTLNPLDPKSLELVKKMYGDMLPLAKSKNFNMNFDEPFELGHGRTEGMDEGEVYLDYMLKAYQEIKKYDKDPLIWGDVLLRHPDKIDLLPKDMTFIDWGYDATSRFDKHAKLLKSKGVKFMCAPGTTSWCSFFGRYIDWYENIKNAVDAVINNGGDGVILTDWGDFGHLQFLSASYAPIVFMGLYSWCHLEGTILLVRDYLNDFIYHDNNHVIGDLLIDLAHYSRYDVSYGGNGSRTFYTFMWGACAVAENVENKVEFFLGKNKEILMPYHKYMVMDNFLNSKLEEIKYIDVNNDETKLTIEEIKQTIQTIKMIQACSVSYDEKLDKKVRIKLLEDIYNKQTDYLNNQRNIWLTRNKQGGLDTSISYLTYFLEFIKVTINYLNGIGEKL